jgi:hypothetical protein
LKGPDKLQICPTVLVVANHDHDRKKQHHQSQAADEVLGLEESVVANTQVFQRVVAFLRDLHAASELDDLRGVREV